MSGRLRIAADFYRIARYKKPAVPMMIRASMAMSVLIAWASLAPISESVVHSAKIVPRNRSSKIKDGALSLSVPLSGKVVAVLVNEQQEVRKGEVLIRLDQEEFCIKRKRALAEIESVEREIEAKLQQAKLAAKTIRTQMEELSAQLFAEKEKTENRNSERAIKIKNADSELNRIRRERDRFRNLIAEKAISQSELDTTEADYSRAKEELALASLPLEQSRVQEIESRIKFEQAKHEELLHEIKIDRMTLENQRSSAQSEIELLDLRISQCEIVSPIDGRVSKCNVSVGDCVSPGPVDITVAQAGFIAEVHLPSRSIGNVEIGQRAKIMIDGLDWLTNGSLDAEVSSISPDLCHEEVVMGDGSTLVVDGYRVLLEIEPADFKKWNSIRIGMTGMVQIETGEKKLAIYLVENAVGNSLFGPQ